MNQSNIIMYTTEFGLTKIEVAFDGDTVWLPLETETTTETVVLLSPTKTKSG